MKTISAFLAVIALSCSAVAAKDGLYTCRSEKAGLDITYRIKNVNLGGVSSTHLEVTQVYHKNPADPNSTERIYTASGFATEFTNNTGGHMLALENLRIELKDGRPSCVK